MVSVVGRMAGWARRTTAFAELGSVPPATRPVPVEGPEPIYRLRKWPSLPHGMRSVATLRLLSIMSTRPVNRGWIVRHTKLQPTDVDLLIERLRRNGDVEVIDPSGFAALQSP